MDTNQFIRHYTRLILAEASSGWETRYNSGGKTLGASEAEGRAKRDPGGLLRDLGVSAGGGKLKPSQILKQAIESDVLSDVFETPRTSGGDIVVDLVIIDDAWPKTPVGGMGSNAWRYLRAILDASEMKGIIDLTSGARLSYQRQVNEGEKACRIIISAR